MLAAPVTFIRRLSCVVVLALSFSAVTSAVAQTSGDARAAGKLFEDGAALYREGRFHEAIDRFQEAYKRKPEPVLLYNVARAYERMGDIAAALDAYRAYLALDPKVADRGAIEANIATLTRQLSEQHQRQEQSRAPVPPPGKAAADETPTRGSSPVPWIVAGVGGVALGVGGAFGILATTRNDAARDAPTALRADEARREAEQFATLANVTLIAGGVVALAGVVWGLLQPTTSRRF